VDGCDLTERRMYVRVTCEQVRVLAPALLAGYRSPFTGAAGADKSTVDAILERFLQKDLSRILLPIAERHFAPSKIFTCLYQVLVGIVFWWPRNVKLEDSRLQPLRSWLLTTVFTSKRLNRTPYGNCDIYQLEWRLSQEQ